MKTFVTQERCTTYFRDYAINQIKVAYRLMEYLEPDSVFKSEDLSSNIMKLFLDGKVADAVYKIINDELMIDISSSNGSELFQEEAFTLAIEMLKTYNENCQNKLIKEREKLTSRIKEIDKEFGL